MRLINMNNNKAEQSLLTLLKSASFVKQCINDRLYQQLHKIYVNPKKRFRFDRFEALKIDFFRTFFVISNCA